MIISDRNAATNIARFEPAEVGIGLVDHSLVYADSWNHADPFDKERCKQAMQAEVLVPDCVDPDYIIGAYAGSPTSRAALETAAPGCEARLRPRVLFG